MLSCSHALIKLYAITFNVYFGDVLTPKTKLVTVLFELSES